MGGYVDCQANDDVLKGKSFQQSLKSPGSQTKIDFDVHFPGKHVLS
jgi:hypothetical protein